MNNKEDFYLFLDDYRTPLNCISYMHSRIGARNLVYHQEQWTIAKNYDEFISVIQKRGVPKIVSFDHDLAEEHYIGGDLDIIDRSEFTEKTGYDCAKYLLQYCVENNLELPEIFIHSMNPVGADNIKRVFSKYTENDNTTSNK